MKLNVTGRHLAVTDPIREEIDKRFRKLERMLNDSAVSAQMALRFSGRLMVISVVPSALFSTRTFCIGFSLCLNCRWLCFRTA